MRLLWIEKPLVVGEPLLLDEVHVRHLRDVLRMRVGAKLQARSPYLPYHLAEIVVTRIEKRSLEVEVLQIQAIMPPAVEITLVQSYPKASKFDDILRMAIEAGVSAVRPVISEHSDFKERGQKTERWGRIAREAIEQSGNLVYNKIEQVCLLGELLQRADDALEIVCHPASAPTLEQDLLVLSVQQLQSAKQIRIFVGPEGGFSLQEVEAFLARGAYFYHFGETILRTEHAGLYALGAINTLLRYKGV